MFPDPVSATPSGAASSTRALAAAMDWTQSPLGVPTGWPAALRQSFSLCLDSPIMMAVYWGDDFCLLYGDVYAPILADKHPAALGRKASEVWAEIWDMIHPQLRQVMETGQSFLNSSQRVDILQHGVMQEKHFTYAFMPIRDADGVVVGVFNTAHETTAQVLAERARGVAEAALAQEALVAAESRDLLGLMTENAPDVIYVKDIEGRMVHVNAAFCQLFDLPLAQIIGRDASHWLPAEQAAAMSANDQRVMASRRTHALEEVTQIVGPNGPATRLYLSTKSPWIAADGTLLGLFGISRDITERKAQEQALQDLNDTLELKVAERTRERDRIWRVSREIFVVVGTNGMFVTVNPAYERMLGWTLEEATHVPFMKMVHPDDRIPTQHQYERLLLGTTVVGFKCRFLHRDGSYRWLDWTAVPEGELLYAVGRDCTDEQAQAETLALAEEQLRHSHKMEAVGQLTGGIAHDFNNLLAAILTNLELLQLRADAGRLEDLPRHISAAQTSAQRAASLTHRLLAFSRRQSLNPQAVDVNALVRSMEELMRRTLGVNIELKTQLEPAIPAAFTDTNQLESAMLNLAINARDAMEGGGRLTIATQLVLLAERYTSNHEELEPGQYLSLNVSDTGVGMTPDVMTKAFDPFFTTKAIGKGTGLGLSMIYGYARQSGGHVRIESEPGQGTTVRLYLPVHQSAVEPVLVPAPPVPQTPQGHGESVLVVEDEPGVRLVVLDVLEELGYRTHEAIDATSALSIVEAGIHLDLLVSDVGLPGINGRQLAEMVRSQRPGLKVLFITGYAGEAAVRGKFLDDGMDMLSKPFTIDELAQKIEQMLHGSKATA
jgi:PAS domain S-box-containing protein